MVAELGADRAALLTHVTADGAEWIHHVVADRAPQATGCLDAFHVVSWATKVLEELRRRTAAQLRGGGQAEMAEATNTHLRSLTKRAYGFHSPDALLGQAMLTRGGWMTSRLLSEWVGWRLSRVDLPEPLRQLLRHDVVDEDSLGRLRPREVLQLSRRSADREDLQA